MPKKYFVKLKRKARQQLERMIRSGRDSARRLARARVLLKAAERLADASIAEAVGVSCRSVERVRRRFCTEGLKAALSDRPQPARPQKRKIDGEAEARLVALACSTPPDGRESWTMQLLADRMVQLKFVSGGGLSDETVRRCLKKTRSSLG